MGYEAILPITSIRLFFGIEITFATCLDRISPLTLRGNTKFIAFYFIDVSPTRVIRHVPDLSFPGNPSNDRIGIREGLRKVVNLCIFFFPFYWPTKESLGLFLSIISIIMILCRFSKCLFMRVPNNFPSTIFNHFHQTAFIFI